MITKRTRFKKKVFLIILGLGLTGFLIFLIFSNYKINQKRIQLQLEIKSLKEEVQDLERKNKELKAEIFETQTEDYLEKKTRENLGLRKPQEGVVVVSLPKENKKENNKEKESFWQKLLESIKNFFKN